MLKTDLSVTERSLQTFRFLQRLMAVRSGKENKIAFIKYCKKKIKHNKFFFYIYTYATYLFIVQFTKVKLTSGMLYSI